MMVHRLRLPARWVALGTLATLLACLGGCRRASQPGAPPTRVVRVLDGDTIEVLRDNRPVRVRLHGVDCPERGQAFGAAARRFTSDFCFGRTVILRSYGHDRYGRLLADVVLPDGRILNHELLRAGLAWWYREYAPGDRVLEGLESEARAARRGLWQDRDPIPPWEFRRAQRSPAGSRESRTAP